MGRVGVKETGSPGEGSGYVSKLYALAFQENVRRTRVPLNCYLVVGFEK